MYQFPIIKKFLNQRCIGYRDLGPFNGTVAIYFNIGVDSRGLMWRWRSEAITVYDHSIGLFRFGFTEIIPSSFTHICPIRGLSNEARKSN